MQNTMPNLFTRDDTFFEVCEGLGQDLGFNPNILRVVLGVLVLWNPVVVLSAYAGAGALVAASRYAFPNRVRTASPTAAEPQPAAAQNDERIELPMAA